MASMKKPAAKAKTKTATETAPAEANVFSKQLRAARERWEAGREKSKKGGGGGGTTLEPGKHTAALTDLKLINGDKGLSVLFEFTATEGDQVGEKAIRWGNMNTDEQMVYLQRDLRKLGEDLDGEDIEALPDMLERILTKRPECRITVKENGDYTNVYLDKMIADGGESEGDTTDDINPGDGGDADDEGVEINPGDSVTYTYKGKKGEGIVKSVREEDGIVVVKDTATKKTLDLSFEDNKVEVLAEVE